MQAKLKLSAKGFCWVGLDKLTLCTNEKEGKAKGKMKFSRAQDLCVIGS